MPITVADQVAAELVPEATVLLAVRSTQPVHQAVRAAAAQIAALDGGPLSAPGLGPGDRNGLKYVSAPVPVPGGALLLVDVGSAPAALLDAIPGLLVRELQTGGVDEASIEIPARIDDRYGTAQELGPAVRAWLRGPTDLHAVAGRWFAEVAGPWLRERGDPVGVIISMEAPLSWESFPGVADAVVEAGQAMAVVTGDLTTAVASGAVAQRYQVVPEASLTEARTDWTASDVADSMRAQREALRAAAGRLMWAGIGVTANARDMLMPQWVAEERPAVELLGDIAVPDATWCQILSSGHIDRLGGPPPGAVTLPGGRLELTVGEPHQWMPGHPEREAVLASARRLLGPCLLEPEEAFALSRERIARLRR